MKRVLLGLALLCVGGIAGVASLFAAKPGGGSPPPAGRIYFKQHLVTYQMNTDGSGKVALALPTVVPIPGSSSSVYLVPSSRTYGGRRWWVTALPNFDEEGNFIGSEVYAFQEGNSEPVQLTAMAADGLCIEPYWTALPRWSGDRQDSFISFVLLDDFDTNAPDLRHHLCRIWIDGDDIAAIAAGAPPLTAAEIEFIFTDFSLFPYGWSSDPDVLAYCTTNVNTLGDIRVRVLGEDPANPVADVAIVAGIYGSGSSGNFVARYCRARPIA